MASVALALDDVGLAVPLQELLEAAGHQVLWSPPLADGPATLPRGARVNVVVLGERAGQPYGAGLEKWRDLDPPPGVLAVVQGAAGQGAAQRERVPFVPATAQPAVVAGALDRALALRWSGRLAVSYARGALGLPPEGEPLADAARILRSVRGADLEVVREALRWHALHYATSTSVIGQLRERRALEIPHVELAQTMDGTRTVQGILRTSAMGGQDAARVIWALACVGAVTFTPEPPDQTTLERRTVATARAHLRARQARMERSTWYDVLEITPSGGLDEIESSCQMLAVRYAPERLQALDLGDLAPLVAPIWQAVLKARSLLSDPAERLRYNEALGRQRAQIDSAWVLGPNDRAAAEEAFARGQRALLAGEPFKAVSEMAAAARAHADHPDYETSLAWARYRAELTRGKPREQTARAERATAEKAVFGRRPWPRALVALALLCAADEDADAARWHLREALACDPNHPTAKQLLARLGQSATAR